LNHRRPSRLLVALLLPLSLSAEIIDRIAVAVGNRVITTSDLDREIRVTAFLNAAKLDFSPAVKRATAERLVEQKLIRTELENSRYPVPTAAEIEPEFNAFRKKFFVDDESYHRALDSYGITEADLKAELLWQRTLLMFIEVRFRPGAQVTEAQVQEYFDKTVGPAALAAHPGTTPSLEDYRAEMEKTLIGRQVDQEADLWLQQVRKRTEIVFHPEALQ
jgi:peptidyl-prolyl cis-trans isomerase SurA